MRHLLSCHSAENLLIITGPKIASSYIRDYYRIWNYGHLTDVTIFMEGDLKHSVSINDKNKSSNNVNDDFTKLFNNELDKDVLILIRNPYKRWVSAFVQDFIKTWFEINTVYIKFFLEIVLKYESIQPHLLKEFRTFNIQYDKYPFKEYNGDDRLIEESFKYTPYIKVFIRGILTNYIQMLQSNQLRFWDNHNSLYHSVIDAIVRKKKANYRIIDIDEMNLNSVLDLYKPANSSRTKMNLLKKNEGTYFTEIVKDLMDTPRFKNTEVFINKLLRTEIDSYEFLKKCK